MADIEIGSTGGVVPDAAALTGTETFYGKQGGATVAITTAQLGDMSAASAHTEVLAGDGATTVFPPFTVAGFTTAQPSSISIMVDGDIIWDGVSVAWDGVSQATVSFATPPANTAVINVKVSA